MRLFVDNLTNIDFSYLCPSRGLVGETWLAHIELIGNLDDHGMVCDFGIVKKELRHWLDTELDHRLLVPAHATNLTFAQGKEHCEVTLKQSDDSTMLWTRAPHQAITLIDTSAITAESAANWCIDQLGDIFGQSIAQIRLSFTSEHIEGPSYHYSHGLKKHLGNCQRIAHGHRSKILIWRNGTLCQQTMKDWAAMWQDIYIATQEDLLLEKNDLVNFRYTAEQGTFELSLPKNRCYFIDTDTTVEHIATHIAKVLSAKYPTEHIKVKAFEGIGKGAIMELTGELSAKL